MISPFQSKDTRNALTYNGYTFNQEIGGSSRDIVEVNRIVTQTVLHTTHEAKDYGDGLETYGAYKRGKRLTMWGVIRASTRGGLYDRIEEFAAAVDPAAASRDNPDTFGLLPLDFNVPTADTANFVSGLMPCRYYCRAENALEPPIADPQGLGVPFMLTFLASDPRRYLQSQSSLTGAGDASNSIASFYSFPTLSVAMTGAGSASFTITSTEADASLVLNLSGRSNGQAVVVDMERHKVTVDGVETPSLYVSGDFFAIEPGSNTISYANSTNASPTLTWRTAFSY